MSEICGIFSPKNPSLFSADDLASMGTVLQRSGVVPRNFIDASRGIGVSLFYAGAFLEQGERNEPTWLQDEDVVIGLAGNLTPVASRRQQDREAAGWQARLIESEYLARLQPFPVSLDGVYSLFVWDKAASMLTLSTDKMGSRQIYFYSDPDSGYLAFASEPKALLTLPKVPREIDPEAVAFYLRLGFVAPPLTILKRVSKALPFEKLAFATDRTVTRSRYYQLPQPAHSDPAVQEDWVPRIHEEVVDAVARVTRKTPSIALLLSGGIDSMVMLAALHEVGASKTTALTLAFDGATNEKEVEKATQAAHLAGAEHRIVRVGPNDVHPRLLSTILREFDEPTDGFSRGLSEYVLSEEANNLGIRSCLTGLHGESTISDFGWLRYLDKLRKLGEMTGNEDVTERIYTDPTLFFSDRAQREIMVEEVDGQAVIRRIIREFKVGIEADSDFQTFANVDGISDHCGRVSIPGQAVPRLKTVEERSGFADRELIEFGQTIPALLKGSERRERSSRTLLRLVFKDRMPTLATEPAEGAMPGLPWQSQPWLVNLVLRQAERTAHGGLFRDHSVEKIIRKYRTRSSARDFANVWHLFVLQTWMDFHLFEVDPFEGIPTSAMSVF